MCYKCTSTLSQQFTKPKDELPSEQTNGVVYKICCDDCEFVYYGQTDRALITRIKKFKIAVSHSHQFSKIAKHAEQYDHQYELDIAIPLSIEQKTFVNVFLEPWHSLKDQNAGNDHTEIPAVYKTLFSKLTSELCIYYSFLNLVSHFN